MEDFDCFEVLPAICFVAGEVASADERGSAVVLDDLGGIERDLVDDLRVLVREMDDGSDWFREGGGFHGQEGLR